MFKYIPWFVCRYLEIATMAFTAHVGGLLLVTEVLVKLEQTKGKGSRYYLRQGTK